jgi:hypothetical protein
MALKICWYWVLKLKARFLSGDYGEALAAADKAQADFPADSVIAITVRHSKSCQTSRVLRR